MGDIKVDDMTGEYSEKRGQVVETLLAGCTCDLERLNVSVSVSSHLKLKDDQRELCIARELMDSKIQVNWGSTMVAMICRSDAPVTKSRSC